METVALWTGRPGAEGGPTTTRVGPDNLEARLEALRSLASDWSGGIPISDTTFSWEMTASHHDRMRALYHYDMTNTISPRSLFPKPSTHHNCKAPPLNYNESPSTFN